MTDTTIGGKGLDISIRFLDQFGADIPAVPDAAPVWTNNAAFETLVVAANGLSAHADPVAVGADTVSVTTVVGGTSFSASIVNAVTAPPAVLTSIELVAVPTP